MANTVTNNELNVVQGFGERQILRDTEATVVPGNLLLLNSDDEWELAAADSSGLLAIAQNKSSNKDAQGTAYDFVGATAKVIGIPVDSNAEVEIPTAVLADSYTAVIGAAIYAAASGELDDSGSVQVGTVTGETDNGVTVLLG